MAIETEALPVGLDLTGMTPEDLAALRRAVQSLEHPGLAARLTNMVGKPIELIGDMLPASATHAITTATSKGLEMALKVALRTIQHTPHAGSRLLHKALATASGAAGGAFGLATVPIELPVSTIIMLRSIADIARSEGEDLSEPEAALSCVQVFALGGRAGSADASQSGYFAVRGMLAKSVTEAARFIAERGVIEEGAPVLVRFITLVASRFGPRRGFSSHSSISPPMRHRRVPKNWPPLPRLRRSASVTRRRRMRSFVRFTMP
jgi:hypothetical protein